MIGQNREHGFISNKESEAIADKTIVYMGLGGVGGPHARNMVQKGVKRIILADPDTIEKTNANRLEIATHEAIVNREKKIRALGEHVLRINPDLDITYYDEGVTEENVDEIISLAGPNGIIIDGIDVQEWWRSVLVARKAREKGLIVQTGLNIAFGGAVTSFDPNPSRTHKTIEHYYGLPKNIPLNEIKEYPLNLPRLSPYCPSYGDVDTFRGMIEGGPNGTTLEGVSSAATLGIVQTQKHIFQGVEVRGVMGNNRKQPVWYPRWKVMDPYNEINKEVHQHGPVNFMAGLAVGAVLNLVNKVPKASYYEDENF